MRCRPHCRSDGEHEERADGHEHDLQRAFHLVVEAAPAQMRSLELVLFLQSIDLQVGETALPAQIVARLLRPAAQRGMHRRRVRARGRLQAVIGFVFSHALS